jgi:threonine aldolase
MTARHSLILREDVPDAPLHGLRVPGCRTVAAPDLSARHVFASDNVAGVHPKILDAIATANSGHAIAYGDDPWTERAVARLRDVLSAPEAEVVLTFNGTGANVVGLASLLRPYEAVLCTTYAHILVDECGAPTRFSGSTLVPLPSDDGRIDPALVEAQLHGVGDQHRVQPRVVSISQTTEVGTVWQPGQLRALADVAHSNGLYVHLDGARLANAVAALGGDVPGAIEGVDVLTFGATKNGILLGEAVVWLDPSLGEQARFVRKQAAQLSSKQRFIAAQIDALLTDGLWLELAGHANAMARRLADAVRDLPGLTLSREPEANAIFARIPKDAIPLLQERSPFYVWDVELGEVRWVASWDVSEEDVDAFATDVREVLAGG